MGRVEGKVAFITGAARGQGRSHAVHLAREGASIIAVDICADVPTAAMHQATPQDLAQTADEVERVGGKVLTLQVDVRDQGQVVDAVEQGLNHFGRLDIVCANAGIVGFGASPEIRPEAWSEMLDVNVSGVWNTCNAAIAPMVEARNGGSIVITSSVGGLKAGAHVAHYVASKHAVLGLMKVLAIELAQTGIRVNAVCPTNVNTDMLMNENTKRLFVPTSDHPTIEEFEAAAKLMHEIPIGWIEPEDVSYAVLYLAADESRFVTGIALPVDAGALLK
jgi:(+)-trans-carveol dehydrogenase